MIFKDLTAKEMLAFAQWAADNNPPTIENWEIYHPICRSVWLKRGLEPKIGEKSL